MREMEYLEELTSRYPMCWPRMKYCGIVTQAEAR